VLSFPGIFRGALACRAARINEEMKLAASYAIAGIISDSELHPEYIVPSVFDKRVAEAVAREVETAAHQTGVARRETESQKAHKAKVNKTNVTLCFLCLFVAKPLL